jgi:hypothetical protein
MMLLVKNEEAEEKEEVEEKEEEGEEAEVSSSGICFLIFKELL